MSVTGTVARKLAWRAAQAKMVDEYRRWAESGEPLGSYVERRVPAASNLVAQAENEQLAALVERVRATMTRNPERDAEQAREQAERAEAAASAAEDVVEDLRRRRDELDDRRTELEALEHDAEERAATIIAQAEREADERLRRARQEFEALERRIELHVADVRWRARTAADTAIHRATREFDEAMSFANAELERARFAAREASEGADLARERAVELEELAQRAADEARVTEQAHGSKRRADGRDDRDSRARHLVAVRNESGSDLEELSKDALYDIARELEVAGRSKMSRGELLTAVRTASA